MPLFWKPYRSDVTTFLEALKQKNPTLPEEQRQGRALLWDKPQDAEQQARWRESRVPQPAYLYEVHKKRPIDLDGNVPPPR